jgi:anti-anti-sigma factor
MTMTESRAINVRHHGDVTIIDITGDVTSVTGQPIETAYHEATSAGAKKILLVFAADCYINSGGIAVLIGILSETRKKQQKIRMTGLSGHFQKIFGMVGLSKYAQMFPSEDTALAEF